MLVIVVLVFGTKRLGNVGKDLGEAVKGFKKGMQDDDKTSPPRSLPDATREEHGPVATASAASNDAAALTPRALTAGAGRCSTSASPRLFVIAVVALLVLGPERLPKAARFAGLWVTARARAVVFGEVGTRTANWPPTNSSAACAETRASLREAEEQLRSGATSIQDA